MAFYYLLHHLRLVQEVLNMEWRDIELPDQAKDDQLPRAEFAHQVWQPQGKLPELDKDAQEARPVWSAQTWTDIGNYRLLSGPSNVLKPELSLCVIGGSIASVLAGDRGLSRAVAFAPFALTGAVSMFKSDLNSLNSSFDYQDGWLRRVKYGAATGTDVVMGAGAVASVLGRTTLGGRLMLGAFVGRILLDTLPDHILKNNKPLWMQR